MKNIGCGILGIQLYGTKSYDLICCVSEHLDELQLVWSLHIDAFSFGKVAEMYQDQDTSMKLIF